MTTEYTQVEKNMQHRLRAAIRKAGGSITWAAARLAMSPHAQPRDAQFDNLRILGWVRAGEFKSVEQPDGDTRIGV